MNCGIFFYSLQFHIDKNNLSYFLNLTLTSFAINIYVTVVTGEMVVHRSYVHLYFAFCDEFEGALVTWLLFLFECCYFFSVNFLIFWNLSDHHSNKFPISYSGREYSSLFGEKPFPDQINKYLLSTFSLTLHK